MTMSNKITFGSLTIEIEQSGNGVLYTFKGDVDDTFRQQDVPRIKANSIIMDLEGITNFNSCGVREWVFLIKDLEKLGQLNFRKCSIPMVDQFNMVPESIGNGTVESFFAPYVCEDHGDMEVLLDVKADKASIAAQSAPEKACQKCQQSLIFDAMADSYFLFLSPTESKVSKAS
jgi:hypothetical protein